MTKDSKNPGIPKNRWNSNPISSTEVSRTPVRWTKDGENGEKFATIRDSSNPSSILAPHFKGASLKDLETMLRELRQMRAIRKQAGKKTLSQTGIRVELPVGTEKSAADGLLKKLDITDASEIAYVESPKLIAGIRIFIGDTLYDGSFTTLTQNIKH